MPPLVGHDPVAGDAVLAEARLRHADRPTLDSLADLGALAGSEQATTTCTWSSTGAPGRHQGHPAPDRVKAQRLAGELERKQGLEVLEERGAGRGERQPTRPEVERAARGGRPEPHRKTLGRIARAAAVASESEAEFVRRMRRSGVLVDGRIAAGTSDVITG